VTPCTVALARRFSASQWLGDVRRYRATYTNYTGKPLAYLLAQPERSDDADNTLRVAFGNEGSPDVVDGFARRFGLEVIDAYGATEGGVAVNRDAGAPPGALGLAPDHVRVVDEDGNEKPRANIDPRGRVLNAQDSVGEIVNTQGVGPFEGYYNNEGATAKTTRFGWYWSGDLGYKDEQGFLYFAGRNADWIRVDGENFPAGPIEEVLRKAPGVVLAAVYGVPDDQAGDQVMAGIVVTDEAVFDVDACALARPAGRDRAEVAAPLCPYPARSPDHRDEQDRETYAGAPEIPPRPDRRRSVLRPGTRRRAVLSVHRIRRGRAARVVRASRPRTVLGPVMGRPLTDHSVANVRLSTSWGGDDRPERKAKHA
jgi:acyl-CoA synthetase (AMP-forming)/AMP-acid ligase II